jgi:tetratricopeptide (TPR) repeat protein
MRFMACPEMEGWRVRGVPHTIGRLYQRRFCARPSLPAGDPVRMRLGEGTTSEGLSAVNAHKYALAALLAWMSASAIDAHAQALPAPKEFYFDQDRATTRPVTALAGSGDALVDRLASTVQRDPNAAEARAQLAAIAMAGGRRELGEELYQAALRTLTAGAQRRQVEWNYGWDLLRAGDPARALAQWSALVNGRPAAPDWLPPTLALVLWRLDRKDEAVKWYAAAVRTWPDQWGPGADFAKLLPAWRGDERATLAEVQTAWHAKPPAWP